MNKNVLLVGAEMAPLVKVGGLADVMESLPQALIKSDVSVAVLIPYYSVIKKTPEMKQKAIARFVIRFNGKIHKVTIHTFSQGSGKPDVLLLEDSHFFKGKDVYPGGYVEHTHIKKENRRFSFFALAVTGYIALSNKKFDVIHVHDWHGALIPFLLKTLLPKSPRTLLTIHNLALQGVFPKKHVEKLIDLKFPKETGEVNFMKLGIEYADVINTVSPTYAKEILTSEYGEGLQGVLKKRNKDLYGILNGINLDRFNPTKDKTIFKTYNQKTYEKGKRYNRERLLALLKIKDTDAPIYGMVSRIFYQKGFSIMNPELPALLKKGAIIIILGSGDKTYEKELIKLSKKYHKQMAVTIGFDAKLAQQIYAASDFFLMPSKFEPCGLGQMIAMRYGTLPIARATGGLKDTVKGGGTKANGIVFALYTKDAMDRALNEAFTLYKNKERLKKLISNAFKTDFSWDKSAKDYKRLYTKRV